MGVIDLQERVLLDDCLKRLDDRLKTEPAGMRRTLAHISHQVSRMRPKPTEPCEKNVSLRQEQTRLRQNRVASSRNLTHGCSNPSRPRQVLPRGRESLTVVRFDERQGRSST
jgi:hypothetical protein